MNAHLSRRIRVILKMKNALIPLVAIRVNQSLESGVNGVNIQPAL